MKIFNFILTILLSFQFITGYAQPLGTISPAIPKIHIPEDYGAILKKWDSGQNDKLIIHIQDAHCNYEAQTNIARILEGLINDYGVDLVCVEGAEGPVDTAPFSRQADRKVREKVVNKYLRRGYLSASEALAITKGEELEFSIYGLEDLGLYLENFQELRGVLGNQQISKKYLAALRGACQRLKKKIYNKELWEFDRQAVTYHEQGMGLVEWISFLKRRMKDDVQGSRWTNFNFVVESIDLEKKIDFKEVEREREGLVKELEKRLVAEELKKVVEQGVLFKAGKIPALEFYQDLEAVNTHSSKAVPQSGAVNTQSSKAVSKPS